MYTPIRRRGPNRENRVNKQKRIEKPSRFVSRLPTPQSSRCFQSVQIAWLVWTLALNCVHADNYFDRITTASNGRLTRFSHDTISVYANAVPIERELATPYEDALTQSLKRWEEAIGEQLQFKPVSEAMEADIRIHWTNQRRKQGVYHNIGQAVLVRKADRFHVEIKIFLKDAQTLKLLPPNVIQAALLHELGHAIGLWGHSNDPNDVMYFAARAQKPTARDIATWLKVHETPIHTPFHTQAIHTLQEIIREKPEIAENHYSLGAVYADLGDYQSAIAAFQKALKIDPMLRSSAAQVAYIFQQKQLYELAIQYYMRVLGRNPSAEVLGALGTLSLIQGDFDGAVNFLQRALRLAPASSTFNQNLLAAYHRGALQLLKTDQFTLTIKHLKQGLARFPFSKILLFDLAVAYESTENYQNALEIYERLLKLNPEYTAARVGIATTLNSLGAQQAHNKDWEAAISLYEQALDHHPNFSPARQNLEEVMLVIGWEQTERGDLEAAVQIYQKLLKINPENPKAYHHLGIIYFRKQSYQQSIAHLNTALSLNPDYQEAKDNLKYVKHKYTSESVKRAAILILLILILSFIIKQARPLWQADSL